MMRRLALVSMLLAAVLAGGEAASGELVQRGNVRLSFDGRFNPQILPRDRLAPVTVDVRSSIATGDGSPPPPLRRISIAVNRYGRVSTRGLPTCPPRELEQTSTKTALDRCRNALVGRGVFLAKVDFPNLAPFPVEGRMLAFNGKAHGRPMILIHIYGWNPVQTTIVLRFKIAHPSKGTFGTVLTARIPEVASDVGYITDISFSFGRHYRYAGEWRNFLSARCAAPEGFPGALFTFARGSFSFVTGQTLPITLARECLVR